MLDCLLRIAADERVSWKSLALAGRGITAEAKAREWVLLVGKPTFDGVELANLLIHRGKLHEDLMKAWNCLNSQEIDEVAFMNRMKAIVEALERWIPEG
ncbi:hypothetical protein [Actinomadura rugatobispora]|uniref:Uncharacterized protein n=1 Tax=Actinomadura rugatobispora TaxID=1994 RepID=A0ABW0ZPZ1_9ACTN|nr:hypothetical protein GCM10010200_001860 [Actinomadura rugatobispora]